MTTAAVNYQQGDSTADSQTRLKGVITNVGSARMASAIVANQKFTIAQARFGSDLLNTQSDDQLRAATDVSGKVYQCGSDAISCRLQAQDVIEYSIYLSPDVGNFKIGNYGLFDDEGNLILLVVLNEQVSKTNQTSASGPNAFYLVPLLQFSNVTGAINVNVETSGNASIPVVMTTADLPDGTKSPYSSYIVESDPTFGNVANLYIFSNNSWVGMVPSSVGHYLYQNIQNAAIAYGATVNDSIRTTVLQGSRGSTSLIVQGAYTLPPYTQYAVSGDGIPPQTVATKSSTYQFNQQTYLLSDPIQGNIAYQTPVRVQTSHLDISRSSYPCYSQINGNQIVLDGVYSFLDSNTTYQVQGEYIPDGTTITQADQQRHDTIIRNKVQISPALISTVPAGHPCTLTAVSHYSVHVTGVSLNTQSLTVSCPLELPTVSDSVSMTGTFSRVLQTGKPPTLVTTIKSCTANSDGTYTLIVDGIDSIDPDTYGEVKVTTTTRTLMRNGGQTGQTEIDLDGSFDTALTEYTLAGDAFQPNTRILDYVPTLQNTTTITISNSVTAPAFVENVTVVANKKVEQDFDTTVSVPAFNKSNSLSVAGTYDDVKYVVVNGHIYPVMQVTNSTSSASRTVVTLSKPLLSDLAAGTTVSLIDPSTPIGDFSVLSRILSGFISKQDSQSYLDKLTDLLEDQYNAGKAQLANEATQLASNLGSQQQANLNNLQSAVSNLQSGLASETSRAQKQENLLSQGKLNLTGGTLEGSLIVQDYMTVQPSGNSNASLNAKGVAGQVSLTPSQNGAGIYQAVLSYTDAGGTKQSWLFNNDGTISLPTGATLLTTTTPNVSEQSFTVSEVVPGQFIKFPTPFDDDDITLSLTPSSQGYVSIVSYLGKTSAGFEVNFLCYDQQGNLLPTSDVVLPELSVRATGKVNFS